MMFILFYINYLQRFNDDFIIYLDGTTGRTIKIIYISRFFTSLCASRTTETSSSLATRRKIFIFVHS